MERLPDCLDDTTIAAMVDGTATPAERAGVEAHLDSCADCYEVLASAARFVAEEEDAIEARPARAPWRLALIGVILLAAAGSLYLLLA